MKTCYVLVDHIIWDGDPEYDQLLGLIEDSPKVLLGTKIEGVTVLTEVEFCRQFNKGKITSRKYELFTIEV
jgi:hypothetical protein